MPWNLCINHIIIAWPWTSWNLCLKDRLIRSFNWRCFTTNLSCNWTASCYKTCASCYSLHLRCCVSTTLCHCLLSKTLWINFCHFYCCYVIMLWDGLLPTSLKQAMFCRLLSVMVLMLMTWPIIDVFPAYLLLSFNQDNRKYVSISSAYSVYWGLLPLTKTTAESQKVSL